MTHIMVDIETLGTDPNAVIASIGAVSFNEKEITGEFEVNVNLHSQMRENSLVPKATITADTIVWWMHQAIEARMATFPKDQGKLPSIGEALQSFAEWAADEGATHFWSHGATFDLVTLNAANVRVNGEPLFTDFRNLRDTRTLYEITGVNPKTFMGEGTAHSAIDDSRAQALAVIESWRLIREWQRPVVHVAYLEKNPFSLDSIREREPEGLT